jgi:putative sterol carrier protein
MPTVSEIFGAMSSQLESQDLADMEATIQFELSGDNGGNWYAAINGGKANVQEGKAEAPTATVKMDGDDFVAMTSGKLNAVNAFMMGKIKVEGDLNTVMKFQSMMG